MLRIAVWLLVLASVAIWLAQSLSLSGDLRLFMPSARNDAQRLLLEQLGEGPGSRLLLIALHAEGEEPPVERSRMLRDLLRERQEFVWASNGEEGLDDIPARLHDYRYLLSAGPSQGSLKADALHDALQERLLDLASPAASLIAPVLAQDPTLESLRLIESWRPQREPQRVDGAWVSATGEAMLVAETRAAGFDPSGQQQAQQALRDAYAEVLAFASSPAAKAETPGRLARLTPEAARERGLEVSGPGAFAERMSMQTQAEASRYASWAVVALLVLLTIGFRSIVPPLLGALPLASAALAGLAATALLFGSVHGITLAFGFTLIGVAQDYPIHLFSHRRPGEPAVAAARRIWPTLALGAFSSALAYLVFFFTGVEGLRQLAVLTVTGLIVAALCTRFMLPAVLMTTRVDAAPARSSLRRARPRWVPSGSFIAVFTALLGAVLLLLPDTIWWEDDLAALTPVPVELLQRDRVLRHALAAPDVRWMMELRASNIEDALQRSEGLQPELDALVAQGSLGAYDFAARYLPSAQRQQQRQAALPAAADLQEALDIAQQGLPFRPGAFQPFLAAVERARTLSPLEPGDLQDTALALRLNALLVADTHAGRGSPESVSALIQLSDPRDLEALQTFAVRHPGLVLHDLKQIAGSLASAWREQLLMAMLGMALVLTLLVAISLRSVARTVRVLLPVVLGTWLTCGLLHAGGQAFTLFHLVAMVLAAGLGLDYALFFERARGDEVERARTLHSVVLCALSTLLVFGLLALSSIPVLRALGITVAIGVAAHFALSFALARGDGEDVATIGEPTHE